MLIFLNNISRYCLAMFRIKDIALTLVLALMLIVVTVSLPCAQSQSTAVQYILIVNGDGSASWKITQVTSIDSSTDTWTGFMQRVISLIDAASSQSGRVMTVDEGTFEMSTTNFQDTQSKTIEYKFEWLNFSILQSSGLTFGDVFRVGNFFGQLYGDGTLQVSYPPGFVVESVSPSPNERDDSQRMLQWLGTQFFANGSPSVSLTLSPPSPSQTSPPITAGLTWQVYLAIGLSILAGFVVFFVVFYVVRHNRRKLVARKELPDVNKLGLLESEEEKVLKVIRSRGGVIFQSAITEECRFSKAKTSQLLTALERKGVVRRYKRGRDKIVTLIEHGKDENS